MTGTTEPSDLISCLKKSDVVVEGRATILSGPDHDDWPAYAALLEFDFDNPSIDSVLDIDTAWPSLSPAGVRMYIPRLIISSINYPECFKTSNFFLDFVWSLSRNGSEFSSKEKKRFVLCDRDLLNCLKGWVEWVENSEYCEENHITARQIRNLEINISFLLKEQLRK